MHNIFGQPLVTLRPPENTPHQDGAPEDHPKPARHAEQGDKTRYHGVVSLGEMVLRMPQQMNLRTERDGLGDRGKNYELAVQHPRLVAGILGGEFGDFLNWRRVEVGCWEERRFCMMVSHKSIDEYFVPGKEWAVETLRRRRNLRHTDGTDLPADVIILATGYGNMNEWSHLELLCRHKI